jgi:protein Tob/BTG
MRLEVHSAADFLMNLLRVKQKQRNSLSESQLQNFKGSLADVLMRRYHSHWYPALPHKGSGFRCIRINGKLDPLIEQAGSAVGLPLRALKKMLPHELTMWIDPDEVSYRIGENGSICVLYDISHHRASPSSDLDSTASSNGVAVDEFVVERLHRSTDMSMSNDLNGIMEEFFENSSARIITKPKGHSFNHNRNTASLNNSLSSTSSGQLSPPPLSPPFTHNNQQQHHNNNHHQFVHQNQFRQQQPQQQPPHSRYHQQQQLQQQQVAVHQQQPQQQFNNHQFNYNNTSNNNFMNETTSTTQQQFYQWENSAFHSHHGNNNKVRTQC